MRWRRRRPRRPPPRPAPHPAGNPAGAGRRRCGCRSCRPPYFEDRRHRGELFEQIAEVGVDLLPLGVGELVHRRPSGAVVLRVERGLRTVQRRVQLRQPGVARLQQAAQPAEDRPGPVQVGPRRRQVRPAAVVGAGRQLELLGVLDDLVRPQAHRRRVHPRLRPLLLQGAHRAVQGGGRRPQRGRGLAVPQPVLDPVEAGEVLVGGRAGSTGHRPVDGRVRVAEGVVGRAHPLVDQMCGQPVAAGRGQVAAVDVRLQLPRAGREFVDPLPHPLLVRQRRRDQVVLVDRRRGRPLRLLPRHHHGRPGHRVGVVLQALERVAAAAQVHGHRPGRPRRQTLHLAVDQPGPRVGEIDLGSRARRVVQVEDLRTGLRPDPAPAAGAGRHLDHGVPQAVGRRGRLRVGRRRAATGAGGQHGRGHRGGDHDDRGGGLPPPEAVRPRGLGGVWRNYAVRCGGHAGPPVRCGGSVRLMLSTAWRSHAVADARESTIPRQFTDQPPKGTLSGVFNPAIPTGPRPRPSPYIPCPRLRGGLSRSSPRP
ncbi:hypothetical protein SBRY_70250 [Actinacidiphila bryophytorum]|uniref:Uncharacterized protein n=1 Tax=Actinacidiphila bryophytorum TaxID=1436133 RepID=A0A9W4H7B9_9ACTN|nr:hypothetical protein SBRY_70250 [Actinacidiphila bryophytorum]